MWQSSHPQPFDLCHRFDPRRRRFKRRHQLAGVESQSPFGIEPFHAGRRGQLKQHFSEQRFVELCPQRGYLRGVDAPLDLETSLFDLFPDRFGKHQRRQPRWQILEDPTGRCRGPILFFQRFDCIPLHDHLVSRIQLSLAKYMRMTPHQLFVNLPRDILEIKESFFLGQSGMKNDLDQYITQFFAHVRHVLTVDRVDQFTRFINQTPDQRGVGLLLIPRAAGGLAQSGHGSQEIVDGAHARDGRKKAQRAQELIPRDRECFLRLLRHFAAIRLMSDKLTEIMAWKRNEIAPLVRAVSTTELEHADASSARPPSFSNALKRNDGTLAVIAEIKRRSPSAGDIKADASALEQAQRYQTAGADALSILTDEKFFGGTLKDLTDVTAHFRQTAPARPCLRKDFMVHPIQVLQARQSGASAILIIVRALSDEEIKTLFVAAQAAGLDALFEIHHETELDRALSHGAKIIGVNNRDLAIFKTDLGLSERLIPLFPAHVIAVSESGIFTTVDAHRAHAAGAHAVLVGEALMKAADPAGLIGDFRLA